MQESMTISIFDFKEFARISSDASPGAVADGVVVFTKNPPNDDVLNFSTGDLIVTQRAYQFKLVEDLEINESQTSRSVAVQSVNPGSIYNLQANTPWRPFVNGLSRGITITNPTAFTLGIAPTPEIKSNDIAVEWCPPPDSVIQDCLDLAKQNVLTKLGETTLMESPAIKRAVYMIALFYVQNRNTQEIKTGFHIDDNSLTKDKTEYYRERVFKAINKEVDNILRPYVNVLKFMPGGSDAT